MQFLFGALRVKIIIDSLYSVCNRKAIIRIRENYNQDQSPYNYAILG